MNDNHLPQRRSVRWRGYNYAGPGTVFITICTAEKLPVFGTIPDDDMHLSAAGHIAHEEWISTLTMRTELIDHGWVIMPNHIHTMFTIDEGASADGNAIAFGNRLKGSVASIVAGYKSAVTRRSRSPTGTADLQIWQRGFHEHVVRDEKRFDAIAAYIAENPKRWSEDTFNPLKK